MAYRDEHQALRDRVTQLERELAGANGELASRGGAETMRPNPFLGGPTRLTIERTLPPDLDEDALARMVAKLRADIGAVGRLERIGSSVAWSSGRQARLVEMTLERTEGGTKLRITEQLQQLIGSLFGGILCGLGGGGVVIPMSPIFFGHFEWALPFTFAAWLGGVYLATRALYKSRASKRHAALGELADALVAIAAEGDAQPVRARVEVSAEHVEQAEATVEVQGTRDFVPIRVGE